MPLMKIVDDCRHRMLFQPEKIGYFRTDYFVLADVGIPEDEENKMLRMIQAEFFQYRLHRFLNQIEALFCQKIKFLVHVYTFEQNLSGFDFPTQTFLYEYIVIELINSTIALRDVKKTHRLSSVVFKRLS